jgi:nucleotide-binding universal stress UspA family protein
MAEHFGAEVEVLYVGRDIEDVGAFYGETDEGHAESFRRWERERSRERLEEACSEELTSCAKVNKKVVLGEPFDEIMKAIETDSIDMVVMATRGAGSEGRRRMPFGSVADKLVKHAPVPVLTVNPPE